MRRLNLRDETRKSYTSGTEGNFGLEQLRTGALLRMADAMEKMVADYDQLKQSRDFHEKRGDLMWEEVKRVSRSNAALRGVITRMKKDAAR